MSTEQGVERPVQENLSRTACGGRDDESKGEGAKVGEAGERPGA